jgi:hypothetical protein
MIETKNTHTQAGICIGRSEFWSCQGQLHSTRLEITISGSILPHAHTQTNTYNMCEHVYINIHIYIHIYIYIERDACNWYQAMIMLIMCCRVNMWAQLPIVQFRSLCGCSFYCRLRSIVNFDMHLSLHFLLRDLNEIWVSTCEYNWFQVASGETKWIQVSSQDQARLSHFKEEQVSSSDFKWYQVSSSVSKWEQAGPNYFPLPIIPNLLSGLSWLQWCLLVFICVHICIHSLWPKTCCRRVFQARMISMPGCHLFCKSVYWTSHCIKLPQINIS